jgi:Family of unknown function (DUF6459)
VTASRIPAPHTSPVASLAPHTSPVASLAPHTSPVASLAPHRSFTSPIIDYEPPLVGTPAVCPPPSSAALHRHTPRRLRSVPPAPARESPPPRAATVFADTALRRVLEVVDRRRPVTQLRKLLAPTLIDAVVAMTRTTPSGGAAVLRRVRLRTVISADGEATAAEVFATYTRGSRVRAVAGRIDVVGGRWLVTALHIG